MILTELPTELLSYIASFCVPADVVNLAVACPRISGSVLPAIYQCIVIDPVPQPLFAQRVLALAYTSATPQLVRATTVHTIAGIKQLLDTLANCPKYAQKVRSLNARGNIPMSDNSLIPRLRKALVNLTQLREFEWTACPELPPNLLLDLPHDANGRNLELCALTVDLAARPSTIYPEVYFPNLLRLRVRPFLDTRLLRWIKQVVAESHELLDVQLSRYLDTKSEVGSSFAFVGRSDVCRTQEPVPAVSLFFDSGIRWPIKTLDLRQIDTSKTDAAVLERSMNLVDVKELRLVGSGHEDEHGHGLLAQISLSAPQLEKVELDWACSLHATAKFLNRCCKKAKYMKLCIKEHPHKILMLLVQACQDLERLEIEVQCGFTLSDFQPLTSLNMLQVLKLPFNFAVNSWEVGLQLMHLKILELHVSSTSTISGMSPNRGLISGGIADQWNTYPNRSQLHTANVLKAAQRNESLEYIIVDGHITPLKINLPSLESYSW